MLTGEEVGAPVGEGWLRAPPTVPAAAIRGIARSRLDDHAGGRYGNGLV
jgi:hypothetical protein